MLDRIGVRDIDELLGAIPKDARHPKLGIGAGLSELEVQAHLERIAKLNTTAGSGPFFIGGSIQRRYIPAAVPVLALRGEFLTAYTPYQPEVSQGTLQATFEYQSLMAELLAMEVVNSSMYDGGSATAEAAFMAVRVTGRKKVVVATEVDFTYRRTLRTYGRGPELEIVEVPTAKLAASAEDAACLIVQHPDAFGSLVDVRRDNGRRVSLAPRSGGPPRRGASRRRARARAREASRRAPGLRDRKRRSVLRSLHAAHRDRGMGSAERAHRARDPGRSDRVA